MKPEVDMNKRSPDFLDNIYATKSQRQNSGFGVKEHGEKGIYTVRCKRKKNRKRHYSPEVKRESEYLAT